MDQRDWILWQLCDSALPTGGFISSNGLEAVFQMGAFSWKQDDASGLWDFLVGSLDSTAALSLPILRKLGEQCPEHPASAAVTGKNPANIAGTESVRVEQAWIDMDRQLDAMLRGNAIARRCSKTQGTGFLTAILKSDFIVEPQHIQSLTTFKRLIRLQETPGHFCIVFGITTKFLGMSMDQSRKLFMFLHCRSIISAAVRLNIVGPYGGQSLLTQLNDHVDRAIDMYGREQQVSFQTNPLLDLLHSHHDRLYSKLFNS